ncbi:MAG: 6-phosphofructokinase [Clostridia bacterium]|nr:MAG: 6-phosphofructokinase [Clostridia bacterium]
MMTIEPAAPAIHTLAVMTSGGDAPGMNAAIRAVVRRALTYGLKVYGIHRGWLGAVEGGDAIEELRWESVGGILQRGGTILGTARCQRFRTRAGRLQAAVHLYQLGINALVVIGGDGSLTGASILHQEWAGLLKEAASRGAITLPKGEPLELAIVGLPGSIDNDTYGSDMSIGADTALHRIVTAADQLTSTAAAHQRTFVMEVMGRNCGYLALAGALAAGSQWVLIPEEKLDFRWHQKMVEALEKGRKAGRQHAMVMMAEGARHPDGLPLDANSLKQILSQRLNAQTRVTVLGHVQRGGAPSVFDRILATRLGAAAVDELVAGGFDEPPRMIGIHDNHIVTTPLPEVIDRSSEVGALVEQGDYQAALELRGVSFQSQLNLLKILTAAGPQPEIERGNLLIVTAGHDAPGMNAAVRVATRMALNNGYRVLAAEYGLEGLLAGRVRELGWMDVSGWVSRGGSELGAGWYILQEKDLPALADVIQQYHIQAILLTGGSSAYKSVEVIAAHREKHPNLAIPIVLVPASINNNLPGTDFSIGADTALNNIVGAVDKIKDTAGANKRVFIIQVMGYHSGYLAIFSGMASGAEEVYIPEEGIRLAQIVDRVEKLRGSFAKGRRLAVIILNEVASSAYDASTIQRLMEEEGGNLFDVRSVILGHVQRGGAPTPFDRILATRLSARAVEILAASDCENGCFQTVGLRGNSIITTPIKEAIAEIAWPHERPKEEWFIDLVDLVRQL